jgi:hypothetical protein
MARVRIAGTTGASENTIVFSPAGGHSHNGRNSSLIDSTAYSMFDFSPTFVGTEVNPGRAVRQENNRIAFEDTIRRVVNSSVLAPAGIRLEPGSLNGSLIIANTITANNLAANTITASEIAAGTITATQLSSNIVLINNRITSQNWNGTIEANGTILSNNIGSAGWAITNTHAVFDSTLIRGSIAANSLVTPNLTISNTGAIISTNFNMTAGGNITANNATIIGSINAGSSITLGSPVNFSVNSAGSVTAKAGRIGPVNITTESMNSQGSSPYQNSNFNYYNFNNFGDIEIYSNPGNDVSSPHAGEFHKTTLVGEYIEIKKSSNSSFSDAVVGARIGNTTGNDSTPFTEMVLTKGTATNFMATSEGNVSFSGSLNGYGFTGGRHDGANQMVHTDGSGYLQVGYINSWQGYIENTNASPDRIWGSNGGDDAYLRTYRTSALSVAYAVNAGYATTAGLRLGRILDITSASAGQDFVLANGNGSGVLRVASEAGVYSKVVTGRAVQVNSSDLIGTTASTARLKQDIEPYIFNEQAILSIEPKKFKYNEKVQHGGDDSDWQYGFIAEEAVAAGLSELCGFDEEGLPDYFAYERMCVAQQQIIRTLWSKVEFLESRVQTLEGV